MSAETSIARDVADRQVTMFAMFVGPGLHTTRAALARASKIPDSTLREWANGATIPFWAVALLRRFLPPEAINMIAEPAGVRLVDIEETESNWFEVAATAAGLTAEICEAGKDGKITPSEKARLRRKARELIADAQAAVGSGE